MLNQNVQDATKKKVKSANELQRATGVKNSCNRCGDSNSAASWLIVQDILN
jgi:bacterioferritin-associated ferredoxin